MPRRLLFFLFGRFIATSLAGVAFDRAPPEHGVTGHAHDTPDYNNQRDLRENCEEGAWSHFCAPRRGFPTN